MVERTRNVLSQKFWPIFIFWTCKNLIYGIPYYTTIVSYEYSTFLWGYDVFQLHVYYVSSLGHVKGHFSVKILVFIKLESFFYWFFELKPTLWPHWRREEEFFCSLFTQPKYHLRCCKNFHQNLMGSAASECCLNRISLQPFAWLFP